MPYCTNCGSDVSEFAANCPQCGQAQNRRSTQQQYRPNDVVDNGGFGWGLLGFCVPIVGLILFLVWNTERPRTAKAAGMGALISVIAWVLFYVIYFVVLIGMISSGAMY